MLDSIQDEFSQFSSVFVWIFLPAFVASFIQRIFYFIFLGTRRPEKGSDSYQRHYTLIFTGIILIYLVGEFSDSLHRMPSNYYQVMQVPRAEFSHKSLKLAFKKMSLKYHPDKSGGSEEAEDTFMRIRKAYETLNEPEKRNLYERFGNAAFDCSYCKTMGEFVNNALIQKVVYYAVMFSFLMTYHLISRDFNSLFWRLCWLSAMLSVEAGILTGRDTNEWLFPSRPGFEKIILLHKLFLSLSMAMNQLAPFWFPSKTSQTLEQTVKNLEKVAAVKYHELDNLMHLTCEPFIQNDSDRNVFQRKVDRLTLELQLLQDNEYRRACDEAKRKAKKLT